MVSPPSKNNYVAERDGGILRRGPRPEDRFQKNFRKRIVVGSSLFIGSARGKLFDTNIAMAEMMEIGKNMKKRRTELTTIAAGLVSRFVTMVDCN